MAVGIRYDTGAPAPWWGRTLAPPYAMAQFGAADWQFVRCSTRHDTRLGDSGYIRVKLRNVPSCRCLVAELRKFEWEEELEETENRDRKKLVSYTSYKLRAELRGNVVWASGHRVWAEGGAAEESEPVSKKLGEWPQIIAAGREG